MLLMALDVFDNKWPRYCANLAIELWENEKHEHLVKIKYNYKVSFTEKNRLFYFFTCYSRVCGIRKTLRTCPMKGFDLAGHFVQRE